VLRNIHDRVPIYTKVLRNFDKNGFLLYTKVLRNIQNRGLLLIHKSVEVYSE